MIPTTTRRTTTTTRRPYDKERAKERTENRVRIIIAYCAALEALEALENELCESGMYLSDGETDESMRACREALNALDHGRPRLKPLPR